MDKIALQIPRQRWMPFLVGRASKTVNSSIRRSLMLSALCWGRCVAPALGPGRIGFNTLGIPTSDPERHRKQTCRRRLLGPVYAMHSAGDTNKPESAQTQSGGETFRTGPSGNSGIRYARISPGASKETPSVRRCFGAGGLASGQNWQRVPLAFDDCFTTESAPTAELKVSASDNSRGSGGQSGKRLGPLRCRRWARGSGTALPLRVTGFFRGLVGRWLVGVFLVSRPRGMG
jgi:hypothetical protein